MIHRIDRVNPDVDDRVIKPNEARLATNLRFGASTDDENLSGGTLFLGNEQLPFVAPAGTNVCVGIYAEYENRFVFFAMYNSNGNHGIYRINSFDNSVQAVVAGSWLKFQQGDTYNVSMTSVDGKLYWTDNVNEPRMVNVEKGIRTQKFLNGDNTQTDIYPTTPEDWQYNQLKRPPGQMLEVSPTLNIEQISITFKNYAITDTGLQYSYYYVYDNYEESRLAPYTANTYGNYNITLKIPGSEFFNYTRYNSLIRAVVIVVRNGNDGVWRELNYAVNDGTTEFWVIPNVLTSIKTIVSSDITDARFDAVPLQSVTNEIAQNKINHGNYITDYEYTGSPTIDAKIISTGEARSSDPNFPFDEEQYRKNSFVPWGRYTFGVEVVDKYGRTYPITQTKDVFAPWLSQKFQNLAGDLYEGGNRVALFRGNEFPNINVPVYEQAQPFNTVAEYTITGDIPEWAERVNIVRSRAKNIVNMYQSIGYMYLWYTSMTGENVYVAWVWPSMTQYFIPAEYRNTIPTEIYNGPTSDVKYTFQGFVMRVNTNEPFVQADNQYITVYTQYNPFASGGVGTGLRPSDDAGRYNQVLKYKVNNIIGNLIYIKISDKIIAHPDYAIDSQIGDTVLKLTPYTFPCFCYATGVFSWKDAQKPNNYYPLLYNFTLTQEVEADEQTLYVTEETYSAAEYREQLDRNNGFVKGWLSGDGSMCRASKTLPAMTATIGTYTQGSNDGGPILTFNQNIKTSSVGWYGTFISMSPRDIWKPEWNQNIGQVNTTDFNANRSRRLNNAICFSNPLVQGSQINGLNKFNSVDFRLAPAENGHITALVTTNATQREPGVMLAIGTYGISSFYYDAIQLTNVDGSSNVTTTDSYLASQRPLLGQFGTSRPMSITKTPLSTVYWWSDVVNDMIRYSNAGLERLGLTYSFSNFLRKEYNDNPLLITWYDQATDEILLSGEDVNTAVFSERYKTFQGTREYATPQGTYIDRAMGIATKVYYIVDGQVWVTDLESNSVIKNFVFGEYKDPNLTLVTNESPTAVKRWNQIKVLGNRPSSTILSTTGFNTTFVDTLNSFIEPGWWIKRKGDWEAAIRRASNTTGGVMAGKLMESRILYSNFAFNAEAFEKINFIEIRSNVSIVQ